MIKAVELKNFLSFRELNLQLKEFNVLVGTNASGKTNFIRAILALKMLINNEILDSTFFAEKNISRAANENDSMSIEFEIYNPITFYDKKYNTPYTVNHHNYYLEIKSEIGIVHEYLYTSVEEDSQNFILLTRNNENGTVLYSDTFDFEKLQQRNLTRISPMAPPMVISGLSNVIDELIKGIFPIFIYKIIPSNVTEIAPYKNVHFVTRHGENTASVLQYFKKNQPDILAVINELINMNFPNVESIDVRKIQDGFALVVLETDNQEYTLDEIPDGIAAFVGFLTIVMSFRYMQYKNRNQKALIIFEEPERALHYQLMEAIVGLSKSLTPQYQVIISTRTNDLATYLDPEDIILFDKNSKGSRVKRIESREELNEYYKNYNLNHWFK